MEIDEETDGTFEELDFRFGDSELGEELLEGLGGRVKTGDGDEEEREGLKDGEGEGDGFKDGEGEGEGLKDGEGEGLGDGEGEGLGDGEGEGEGLKDGEGEGEGLKDGEGEGEGLDDGELSRILDESAELWLKDP
jgi:hypothetical protein